MRHARDNTTRGRGQRIQRKAIWWQIIDKRGEQRTQVVDGVRRWQWTTKHGISKDATKEVKGDMWVLRRWLGVDDGGGGGRQILLEGRE